MIAESWNGLGCFLIAIDARLHLPALRFDVLPIAEEPLHVQAHSGDIVAVRIEAQGLGETLEGERILLQMLQDIAAVAVGLGEVRLEQDGAIDGVQRRLILVQFGEQGAEVVPGLGEARAGGGCIGRSPAAPADIAAARRRNCRDCSRLRRSRG